MSCGGAGPLERATFDADADGVRLLIADADSSFRFFAGFVEGVPAACCSRCLTRAASLDGDVERLDEADPIVRDPAAAGLSG